jgi:methyltransferase (TIGR00027 family)
LTFLKAKPDGTRVTADGTIRPDSNLRFTSYDRTLAFSGHKRRRSPTPLRHGKAKAMSKIHSKIKHSRTALLTALHRAIGNKEFGDKRFGSDRLAGAFLPFYARLLIKSSKMRTKIKHKDTTKMPGVFEYVLARTAFFDDVFTSALNEDIPQIVILGAGYDSRAYRFSDLNKSSRIIELDNEATQSRKMNHLKKFKIEIPEQVTIAPIDFNKDSLKDVLQRAGYKDDKKALFI